MFLQYEALSPVQVNTSTFHRLCWLSSLQCDALVALHWSHWSTSLPDSGWSQACYGSWVFLFHSHQRYLQVRVSETADHQHHLAEDLGEPGQPEGASARGGRRWQVLPHAQVGCLIHFGQQQIQGVTTKFGLDSRMRSSVQTFFQLSASTSESRYFPKTQLFYCKYMKTKNAANQVISDAPLTFKVVEHRGYSVKLAIWDTAGQER